MEAGDLPLVHRFQTTTMRRGLKIKFGPSPMSEKFLVADSFYNHPFSPPFPIRANRLLQLYELRDIELYKFTCESPPWTVDIHQPCDKLYHLSKK